MKALLLLSLVLSSLSSLLAPRLLADAPAEAYSAPSGSSEQASVDPRLASLRRAVTSMSDIDQIIHRYERFIEQHQEGPDSADESAGPSMIQAARADLATWIERRERGFARLDNAWVDPDRFAASYEESITLADAARRALKDGQLDEAENRVSQMLRMDRGNPSALYLRGLIAAARRDLPAARESFEAVLARVPNHVPSLNNLAVILWRQNQPAAAMLRYEQAMQASPTDRQILDNVAEAEATLTPEQRSNRVIARTVTLFNEQDRTLQQRMAAGGAFRWGATWISGEELRHLRATDQTLRRQLDRLAEQYDEVRGDLQKVDAELQASARELRRLEARSIVRDDDGDLHRARPPHLYDEIVRDMNDLQRRREELSASLERLRLEAAGVEQTFPTPRFTGLQNLIGPEGTPLLLPPVGPGTTNTSER